MVREKGMGGATIPRVELVDGGVVHFVFLQGAGDIVLN